MAGPDPVAPAPVAAPAPDPTEDEREVGLLAPARDLFVGEIR